MRIAANIVTILFLSTVLCSYGHPIKQIKDDSSIENSSEDSNDSVEDSLEDDANKFGQQIEKGTDKYLSLKKRNADMKYDLKDLFSIEEDLEDSPEILNTDEKSGELDDNSIGETGVKASNDDEKDIDLDQLTSEEIREALNALFA